MYSTSYCLISTLISSFLQAPLPHEGTEVIRYCFHAAPNYTSHGSFFTPRSARLMRSKFLFGLYFFLLSLEMSISCLRKIIFGGLKAKYNKLSMNIDVFCYILSVINVINMLYSHNLFLLFCSS